jgi:hypothetical protein
VPAFLRATGRLAAGFFRTAPRLAAALLADTFFAGAFFAAGFFAAGFFAPALPAALLLDTFRAAERFAAGFLAVRPRPRATVVRADGFRRGALRAGFGADGSSSGRKIGSASAAKYAFIGSRYQSRQPCSYPVW